MASRVMQMSLESVCPSVHPSIDASSLQIQAAALIPSISYPSPGEHSAGAHTYSQGWVSCVALNARTETGHSHLGGIRTEQGPAPSAPWPGAPWATVLSLLGLCLLCSGSSQIEPVHPQRRVPTAAPRSLISCFALRGDCPHSCCNQSEVLEPVSHSTTNQGLPKCRVSVPTAQCVPP